MGLIVHLVEANVLGGLAILWFRHLSKAPGTRVAGMPVDMTVCAVALWLVVRAIVTNAVLLATVLE
jgi:hypothetical protein